MREARRGAMGFSSSLLKMVHIDHAFGPLLTPKLDPGHRKITKVCHQYKLKKNFRYLDPDISKNHRCLYLYLGQMFLLFLGSPTLYLNLGQTSKFYANWFPPPAVDLHVWLKRGDIHLLFWNPGTKSLARAEDRLHGQ